MELRKIELNNVWPIVNLSVLENQKNFVATNAESIIEAFATREQGGIALPFGIYENNEPVGFLMIGYGAIDDVDVSVAQEGYCLWRLMVDQKFQGKGYGRKAIELALEYVKSDPYGPGKCCWLSYEPENTVARSLYHQFGFRENGEMDGDEIVAVLPL